MFRAIIHFSVRKKLPVILATVILVAAGIYAMTSLPVDAVPDITNNQVQIVTVSPTLAPQEVEQLITFPVETAMSNIMNVQEIRSVSRFGLSLVTVVFKENVPTLDARQLVNEQIQTVAGEIPPGLGTPELMPITTGLGEIYQYILAVEPGYEDRYDAMELRTIQDWIVRRQLSGIPGIVEINSFGGYLKQYEVAVDPDAMFSLGITIADVFDALSANNQNTGGSYIEKAGRAYYIRSEGMISDIGEIGSIVVANRNGIPVRVSDIAQVRFGHPKRFGAMTIDGRGECVGGIAMMLKGANADEVTAQITERVAKIQKTLPEGVRIEPYLNRSELVGRNISTVIRNLIEGALIVFLVLIIFLGNVRAGLIAASVIPLALLFAFILMRLTGVSANLMSLGAIDFGIVVDGSIVILEGILAYIYGRPGTGRKLTADEMDTMVEEGALKVARSATFAVLVILIVFLPILALGGIEGKYFTPMAKTLVYCIVGALLLSLTYVPMAASLLLGRNTQARPSFADRFFGAAGRLYEKVLRRILRHSRLTIAASFAVFLLSLLVFRGLGAEFIPSLDEGDFAMQMTLPPGSSLSKSIEVSLDAERVLKEKFPEIRHVVAKIGTAEVPTDPMAVEDADVMIVMKPFSEWTSAGSRSEMVAKMKEALSAIDGAQFNFSQPIQLRFNELMTGSKADIAIKIYGEDMDELYSKAHEAAAYIRKIPGASDVIVEQTMGLPQLVVRYDREKIAMYGVSIEELNTVIRASYAGDVAGAVFENEKRFDLVVRLDKDKVSDLNIDRLFIRTAEGVRIPVSEVASIAFVDGPMQINRDAAKRRIVIGVNVRGADIQKVVGDIMKEMERNVTLKPGYYFEYGGQFENLRNAVKTLSVVIPIALVLILLLLFLAFKSITYTLVVFSTIPLSMTGGILALWLRGMPFSISAGVGFIALFGVAVLNGILMINHYNSLKAGGKYGLTTVRTVLVGGRHLLRPVFLTGLVASLGFVPMAVATSAGAEVQRPLATVVIGGLALSTILTLIVIPAFYKAVGAASAARSRRNGRKRPGTAAKSAAVSAVLMLLLLSPAYAGTDSTGVRKVTLEEAIGIAMENHPRLQSARADILKSRASKGESWDGGGLSVSYSWGQINGGYASDAELTVEQSLGPVLTPFYRGALADTRVRMGEDYLEVVRKEVEAEVKRAWSYYLYAKSLSELYERQEELAGKLLESGELRYLQGDIDKAEKNMISAMAADLHTRKIQADEEYILAARRFVWSCYSDTLIVPADTALIPAAAPALDGTPSAQYLEYFSSRVEEKKSILKVERSRLSPEITVGYTNKNIYPLKGLDTWSVGISVPLIFFPQKSRIKQAGIDLEMAEIEYRKDKTELENKVASLLIQLRQLGATLDYYTEAALSEAGALEESALLKFRESETGILEFVQSLNYARDIRTRYLETIYKYNVAALELELYSGGTQQEQ